MKLQEARKYGLACGLGTDAEAVNNIIGYAISIFNYENINSELDELFDDAVKNGIKICPNCGMAQIEAHTCYMEEKWKNIPRA